MPFDSNEITLAMWEQSSGLNDAPSDWDVDANVREFLAVDVNFEGVGRKVNPDNNYVRRAYASRASLPALRNGEFGFGVYLTGGGSVTANGSQAVTFALPELMRNAWGGRLLGYAAAVVTPSTSAPEVTATEGANFDEAHAIFGVNTALGTGQFAIVDSEAADVLTLRTNTDAAINTAGAVIVCYLDSRALTQRQNANYITHTFFKRGEATTHNIEARGCKLTLSAIDAFEAGQEPVCRFEGMSTTYTRSGITKPDLSGTPDGPAPVTVGTGANTSVRIADLGTATLTDMEAFGVNIVPGATQNPVPGLGLEGRIGYHGGGYHDARLEITVPYDEAYIDEFEARTERHIMVQAGDVQGSAVGLYVPRAILEEDPREGATSDETSMVLKYKPLEYEGATALTGTNLERVRSKMLLLLSI